MNSWNIRRRVSWCALVLAAVSGGCGGDDAASDSASRPPSTSPQSETPTVATSRPNPAPAGTPAIAYSSTSGPAGSSNASGTSLSIAGPSANSASVSTPRVSEAPSPVDPDSDESTVAPAVPDPEVANPFTVVASDPLSTFAADVDTASYDAFRQYTKGGSRLPAQQVRIEEWVNYFEYDYPAPAAESGVPFSINLAAAPGLSPQKTVMLRVGIQGQIPPETAKKPTNLVFLVDTSGSMASADKLPLVQTTLLETLKLLAPEDTLSIVTYAGSTRVALAPTPVKERAAIEAVISNMTSGGSTAGAAGLTLAYEQAAAGYIEGGVNHIVLCTDGDFNVGPSSTTELLKLIKQKRETGVTLTALGFGYNNDQMMETVSNAGNGIYGIIASEDQAIEYANKRLLSTVTHIAKDMKIQVEFNPKFAYAYRLIGYDNRAIADGDFRNDVVDAGEIGAGHRVTALYEVVLTGNPIPEPKGAPKVSDGAVSSEPAEVKASDLVLVKIRYKAPGAAAEDSALEVSSSLAPEAVAESAAALDKDFQWTLAVAAYAELMRGSPYVDKAILDGIEAIVTAPEQIADADRQEFGDLFKQTRSML